MEDTNVNVEASLDTVSRPKIEMLELDKLVPFSNHPFKLYEGQRKAEMVESIRASGIHMPIIVRPLDDNTYEILSGHNRVEAAKDAELSVVPVIIREGLTDEEALLIVTETNFHQRSFADMSHSERAISITIHYDAMKKKKGYRSDLIEEIEELSSSPLANKRTMDKVGEQHGLSKDSIARYLRVNKLITDLKERLNNNDIAMRTAVSLSYLQIKEQKIIEKLLTDGIKISMEQAKTLRDMSMEAKKNKTELKKASMMEILKPKDTPVKLRAVKVNDEIFSQYFNEEQSQEEVSDIMAKALELYFSKQDS